MDAKSQERIQFGDFEFDLQSGELLRQGQPVRIQPQPSRVLRLLLTHHGDTVSREELRDHIWGSATYVEFDQGLNYCIRQIRVALGDNAQNPAYIETLPKQGYRFLPGVVRTSFNGNGHLRPVSGEPEQKAIELPVAAQSHKPIRWAGAAGICLLMACAGILLYVARKPHRPELTYTALTDFTDSASSPVLSRDGRMLAFIRGSVWFVSSEQIYVKMLPDGEPRRLTNDPRPKCCLAFSPDGSKIGYTLVTAPGPRWDTYTVPVLGGRSTLLLRNAGGLTWLDQQNLLFSRVKSGLHMGVVTGTAWQDHFRGLYFPAHERGMAHYSFASPDRRSALVVEMDKTGAFAPCRLIPLNSQFATRTVGPLGNCTSAGWSPDGAWMFFTVVVKQQSHIWRQRFPRGQPEQITFSPAEEYGIAVDSSGGSLVTSTGVSESAIWIHEANRDRALSFEGQIQAGCPPRFGRDGRTLFYLMSREDKGSGPELWRMNTESGESEPVLPGIAMSFFDISPDGEQVVYNGLPAGAASSLWIARTDRSVLPRQIGNAGEVSPHFGPGGEIVFEIAEGKFNYVERMNPDGSGRAKVWPHPIEILQGISPGGHWINAVAPIPGRSDIAPLAIPIGGGAPRIICSDYCQPVWSPDGRFLFVPVENATVNSPGRTLAIPVGSDESLPPFPADGIAPQSDATVIPGAQSIGRAELIPGSDLSHFAYVNTTVHRNIYRVTMR